MLPSTPITEAALPLDLRLLFPGKESTTKRIRLVMDASGEGFFCIDLYNYQPCRLPGCLWPARIAVPQQASGQFSHLGKVRCTQRWESTATIDHLCEVLWDWPTNQPGCSPLKGVTRVAPLPQLLVALRPLSNRFLRSAVSEGLEAIVALLRMRSKPLYQL